jgi:hypothetical protein
MKVPVQLHGIVSMVSPELGTDGLMDVEPLEMLREDVRVCPLVADPDSVLLHS